MKQTITAVAIVGIFATTLAFSHADNKSEGAIGDVKYSVLPPDKFREENGNGWVLMDDKVPVEGSTLNTKHGVTEIPDTRGLFIRCLNGTRKDDYADPFSEEKQRARLVLDYQGDSFRKHNHNLQIIIGHGLWTYGDNVPGKGWACQWNDSKETIESHNEGGRETRPENIALYTYIKINE